MGSALRGGVGWGAAVRQRSRHGGRRGAVGPYGAAAAGRAAAAAASPAGPPLPAQDGGVRAAPGGRGLLPPAALGELAAHRLRQAAAGPRPGLALLPALPPPPPGPAAPQPAESGGGGGVRQRRGAGEGAEQGTAGMGLGVGLCVCRVPVSCPRVMALPLPPQLSVDTLQFLLFLYLQQLSRLSLRTAIRGEQWPSPAAPGPAGKGAGQSKVRAPPGGFLGKNGWFWAGGGRCCVWWGFWAGGAWLNIKRCEGGVGSTQALPQVMGARSEPSRLAG